MKKRFLAVSALLLLLSQLCWGQFYLAGDDPGRVKWSIVESPNYKIVYPKGLDSLARTYGQALENARGLVSGGAGYAPGEMMRTKMPVVLHPFTSASNGSVAWAPKRMDLYTNPEANCPEAMPWLDMLSIHESRHAAQMQNGLTNVFRPFNWIFGEMFNGFAAIYPGTAFLEGDAVIAETALSSSGRGRTASFLNRMMIAFDNGDYHTWTKWKTGSYKEYLPNHYVLGYTFLSGMRYFYDAPDYMAASLNYASRKPWNIFYDDVVSKRYTGKYFFPSFQDICRKYGDFWKEEIEARKPWTAYEDVVPVPKMHTIYSQLASAPGGVYAVKTSMDRSCELVFVDNDGNESRISPFSSTTSRLEYSEGKLFWSERVPDNRWSLKGSSEIRFMNPSDGKQHTLLKGSRLYNPSLDSSGRRMAVTSHSLDGRTSLLVVDASDGHSIFQIQVPDSVQVVQSCWDGNDIYASCITSKGYGIWLMGQEEGLLKGILSPRPSRISDLFCRDGKIYFTGEYTGVEELWCLDPSSCAPSGEGLKRLTSNRYGAGSYRFSEDGRHLWLSAYAYDGHILRRISASSLDSAEFSGDFEWKIADKLAQQEKEMLSRKGIDPDAAPSPVEFTAPRRYHRLAHAINIHSWAPLYIDVNDIMNMSYDNIYDIASIGATVLSQNLLGTSVSSLGYAFAPDPYGNGWKNSAHLKYNCTAFYPVIEAQLHLNERDARTFLVSHREYSNGEDDWSYPSTISGKPSLRGSISAYVPLTFNKGGLYRGLIPKISIAASNDLYSASERTTYVTEDMTAEKWMTESLSSFKEADSHIYANLTASVRGYVMRPTAASAIYPRFGIGAEGGISSGPDTRIFTPSAYFYTYGYLPGLSRLHGFKLTALVQSHFGSDALFGTSVVNTLPRGLSSNSALLSHLSRNNDTMAKITAEYAMPVWHPDLDLWESMFYLQRLVITPHIDIGLYREGFLYSAGSSITFTLGSLLKISTPMNIGFTASYNGGTAFGNISKEAPDLKMSHFHIAPILSMPF